MDDPPLRGAAVAYMGLVHIANTGEQLEKRFGMSKSPVNAHSSNMPHKGRSKELQWL